MGPIITIPTGIEQYLTTVTLSSHLFDIFGYTIASVVKNRTSPHLAGITDRRDYSSTGRKCSRRTWEPRRTELSYIRTYIRCNACLQFQLQTTRRLRLHGERQYGDQRSEVAPPTSAGRLQWSRLRKCASIVLPATTDYTDQGNLHRGQQDALCRVDADRRRSVRREQKTLPETSPLERVRSPSGIQLAGHSAELAASSR